MKVVKVINNNIIKSYDGKQQEVLVMGCGIGFKKKPGDEVDDALIEKVYTNIDRTTSNKLSELLEKVPLAHIQLTNDIISYARAALGKKLNDNIYLTLTDHISFAIERHKKGLDLNNALLWEIKKFYPDEYQLGLDALDIVQREAGIRLREDEAGFLAMHIVNAQYGSGDSLAQDLLQVIQDVVNLVRYTYGMELDENSLDYIRFVTHLKFFFSRILAKETYAGNEDLYSIVSVMYPKAAACVRKISGYLRQKLDYSLGLEEEGYLIIHVEKLTRTK